jgi:ethanolamine utilization protein EutN
LHLGNVLGKLHATIKNESLESHRFLIVQPVNSHREPVGKTLICTDWCGARSGDLVYWTRGREASFSFLPEEVATDATIVGIVDQLVSEGAPVADR